jgi:hypothetical protein
MQVESQIDGSHDEQANSRKIARGRQESPDFNHVDMSTYQDR